MTVEELIEQLKLIPNQQGRVKVEVAPGSFYDVDRVVPENQMRFSAKVILAGGD